MERKLKKEPIDHNQDAALQRSCYSAGLEIVVEVSE